jgi:hypothetical protein
MEGSAANCFFEEEEGKTIQTRNGLLELWLSCPITPTFDAWPFPN